MRHLTTTAAAVAATAVSSASKAHPWKSPVPYLFGGLALTMLLIAGALIILACSFRKRLPDDGEKEPETMAVNLELSMEPQFLVIMAGNDKPTYLATPSSTSKDAGAGVILYCNCSTSQQDQNSLV